MIFNRGNSETLAGKFLYTIYKNFLYISVREQTFFNPALQATNTLHLIITDRKERIDVSSIYAPLGLTTKGHGINSLKLNLNTSRSEPNFKSWPFNLKRGDYLNMHKI